MNALLSPLPIHAIAGGLAGAVVGLWDSLLAITAPGLEPLNLIERTGVIGLLTALNIIGGPLLGAILGLLLGLYALLRPSVREKIHAFFWHPRVIIAGSLVLISFFFVWGWRKNLVWSALPWKIPILGAVGLGVYAAGVLIEASVRLRWRAVSVLLLLALMTTSILSWSQATEGQEKILMRIGMASTTGPILLERGRAAFDRDGDGFPTLLCAEDCDCRDDSASIAPNAAEIPGNGIDEDCNGEDLSDEALERYAAILNVGAAPVGEASEVPPGGDASAKNPPVKTEGKPTTPGPETPTPKKTPRPNVLLIVVDTLRANHLGFYGYGLETSKNLDAVAEKGVVFDQARSTGPMTRFSMGPMLTGKYFSEIKTEGEEWPIIHASEVMLGEHFKNAGYHTAAFQSVDYFQEKFGMAQGFDAFDTRCLSKRPDFRVQKTSDFITDAVLEHADSDAFKGRGDAPFLFWAYYSDPHFYYMKRAPYYKRFKRVAPSREVARYDSEIAFTDEHIGRMLDGLASRGLLENTVIVFLSDHGEALNKEEDHGDLWHGANLFDEVIRVPLLISGPGLTPGRVSTPVTLLDVLPTLRELAGLPTDPTLRGISLVPSLKGKEQAHPPVFFEKVRKSHDLNWPPGRRMLGMVQWPYKVVWTPYYNSFQIYDLAADPSERKNILRKLPVEQREQLKELLRYWTHQILKQ